MRVGVYCRVSTDDQAKHGYSLAAQEREGRRKAQEACPGAEVVIYTDDGVSGSVLERPALSRLRDDVGNALLDAVVTLDPDRLSRNLMHLLLLSDEISKRAKLHFVNMQWEQTPEGRMFLSMRGAVAEYERSKIKERSVRGKAQKVRQGKIGTVPLWLHGYQYDSATDTLSVVEDEARIIRRIYAEYVKGLRGYGGIAERLTAEGIPAPGAAGKPGTAWYASTVQSILTNPAYVGRLRQFRHNENAGSDAQAYVSIPPIIPVDVFERVQDIREERRAHHNPGRSMTSNTEFLLSGILFCAECGSPMVTSTSKPKDKAYRYYRCRQSYRQRSGKVIPERCPNSKHKAEVLEAAVLDRAVEWINMSEEDARAVLDEQLASGRALEREAERLDIAVGRLRKGSEGIKRLVALGMMSPDEAAEHIATNRTSLARLDEEKRRIPRQPTAAELEAALQRLMTFGKEIRASGVLTNAPPQKRRAVIRALVAKVTVDRQGTIALRGVDGDGLGLAEDGGDLVRRLIDTPRATDKEDVEPSGSSRRRRRAARAAWPVRASR